MAAIVQTIFFKSILMSENCCILIQISLNFVAKDQINHNLSCIGSGNDWHHIGASHQLNHLMTQFTAVYTYNDVIMGTIMSQITSLTIVFSTVYSDAVQRKHHSSASLAFVRGIHRRPVNSPHKWPVTRKMFPFDDVIMHAGLMINSFTWERYPKKVESGDKIFPKSVIGHHFLDN